MNEGVLQTTVVGSYPKRLWLSDPYGILFGGWRLRAEVLREGQDDATLLAVRDQERLGIDVVSDGEQRRDNFIFHFTRKHLECPKSVRNGACGATTAEGLCGELLRSGIRKPCVFHYRNARDLAGERLARRLIAAAARLRTRRWGSPPASALEIMAAIVNRRSSSTRIYPQVDTRVPGASAIVNAMRGRFEGMTLFGTRAPLPRSVARSEIGVFGLSSRGRIVLSGARRTMGRLPRRVSESAAALALILSALAREGRARARGDDAQAAGNSTYERVLDYEMNQRAPFTGIGANIGERRDASR